MTVRVRIDYPGYFLHGKTLAVVEHWEPTEHEPRTLTVVEHNGHKYALPARMCLPIAGARRTP